MFVYGSAALGALLGALTTSKRVTSHKLPGALGVGVVMYLLIVIFGVLFDLRYGNGGWQMPMAILIAALAGGLIGGSGKRRKSKRVIQNRGKRKGK